MKTRWMTALGIVAMALVGCEGGAPETTTAEAPTLAQDDGAGELAFAGLALEQDNGGIDLDAPPSAEDWEAMDPASFGEDELAELDGIDLPDPADEPGVKEGNAAAFSLFAVWGHKHLTKDFGEPTDWSGSFSVSAGAIKVARVIRFDKGDALVPDGDPRAVTFQSVTGPHHDGLLLRIVVPKAALADKAMLTIDAGPVQMALSLESLDGLQEVITVDELGNRMVLVGERHELDGACPKGLVGGYWKRLSPKGGVFGGKWMAVNGDADGKVYGIWGTRKNGKRVFFGVYASNGAPKGMIAGRWQAFPEAGAGGTMQGHWIGTDGAVHGMLKGVYGGGEAEGDGKGTFQAVWKEACGAKVVCEDPAACGPAPKPDCLCDAAGDPSLCICADEAPVE